MFILQEYQEAAFLMDFFPWEYRTIPFLWLALVILLGLWIFLLIFQREFTIRVASSRWSFWSLVVLVVFQGACYVSLFLKYLYVYRPMMIGKGNVQHNLYFFDEPQAALVTTLIIFLPGFLDFLLLRLSRKSLKTSTVQLKVE